jgi:hypothetical protein
LADDAFKNKFTSLDQIYNLIVPDSTDRIRLKWSDEWAKRPIFRDVEKTLAGVRISNTKALDYSKHRHHFIRLGRTCGFRKLLEFYDLRRGSGKRLNGKALSISWHYLRDLLINTAEALTPEERKQIMGNRGDVYERHYMPSFIDVDCQAIYLGTTRRDDLVRAVGRLERHEGAPKHLTDAQKLKNRNDPGMVELRESVARLGRKIKSRGYTTFKAAAGTGLHDRRREKQLELNSLGQKLYNELLEKSIEEFHETVHTLEVDRQMRGILPAPGVLIPSTIKYELEERATVAELLFQPLDDLDEDQMVQVRLKLVENLVKLSKRQETPHSYKGSRESKDAWLDIERHEQGKPLCESSVILGLGAIKHPQADVGLLDSEADSMAPMQLKVWPGASVDRDAKTPVDGQPGADPMLYCPFCRRDEEAGPRKRKYTFSRPDSLERHLRDQHLNDWAPYEGFNCPYEECSAFLGGVTHFLSHRQRQHCRH